MRACSTENKKRYTYTHGYICTRITDEGSLTSVNVRRNKNFSSRFVYILGKHCTLQFIELNLYCSKGINISLIKSYRFHINVSLQIENTQILEEIHFVSCIRLNTVKLSSNFLPYKKYVALIV